MEFFVPVSAEHPGPVAGLEQNGNTCALHALVNCRLRREVEFKKISPQEAMLFTGGTPEEGKSYEEAVPYLEDVAKDWEERFGNKALKENVLAFERYMLRRKKSIKKLGVNMEEIRTLLQVSEDDMSICEDVCDMPEEDFDQVMKEVVIDMDPNKRGGSDHGILVAVPGNEKMAHYISLEAGSYGSLLCYDSATKKTRTTCHKEILAIVIVKNLTVTYPVDLWNIGLGLRIELDSLPPDHTFSGFIRIDLWNTALELLEEKEKMPK